VGWEGWQVTAGRVHGRHIRHNRTLKRKGAAVCAKHRFLRGARRMDCPDRRRTYPATAQKRSDAGGNRRRWCDKAFRFVSLVGSESRGVGLHRRAARLGRAKRPALPCPQQL